MSFDPPKSRNEAILQNMLGANNILPPPKGRIEELLLQILQQGGAGGGVLPTVTESDNGKVLGVVNGAWTKTPPANALVIDWNNKYANAYNDAKAAMQADREVYLKIPNAESNQTQCTYLRANAWDDTYIVFGGFTSAYLPGEVLIFTYAHITDGLSNWFKWTTNFYYNPALLKHLAPPYDSTKIYMTGDYVTYGEDALQTSSVYRCNYNVVSGDWNVDYWTPVSVMDEIAHKLPLDDPDADTTAQMIVRYNNRSFWQEAPARSRMITAGELNSTFINVLFNVLMPLAKTNGSACKYMLIPTSAASNLLSTCQSNMFDDGFGIRAYPCFTLDYNDQAILFTLKSGVLDSVNILNSTLTFEASYVKFDVDNNTVDIYKIESNLKCVSASENSIMAVSVDYSSATALNNS